MPIIKTVRLPQPMSQAHHFGDADKMVLPMKPHRNPNRLDTPRRYATSRASCLSRFQ